MLGNSFTVDVIAHILSYMDFNSAPLSGAAVLPLPDRRFPEREAQILDLRFRLQND